LKVSQNQLQDLLELTTVDQLLARSRRQIEDLKVSPELDALGVRLRSASVAYLDANGQVEAFEADLKRVEADLAVVEQRIKKDNQSLNNTSSAKDAQGIQSELQTLAKRKSDLEDASLALMEQIAAVQSEVVQKLEAKAAVEVEIKAKKAAIQTEILKLASGIELSSADRKQLAERVPHELMEIYSAKAKRGVPVGRLLNRECGACHMNITASALQDVVNAPADQLVLCPDCSAILVR
jgi:predicted  nucleic acid-binding Zn-ribbon protein